MSKPASTLPSATATPAPSSPHPSESFLSELDGTAPSVLDSTTGDIWDGNRIDSSHLNLVSWKFDVNARAEDGVDKRGFNAISTVLNHPAKKANPLRSSRKPLPPLTQQPPILPRPPPPNHYDAYLQSITPLYDSFVAAQSSSAPDLSDFDVKATDKSDLPSLDSVPELFFDPSFDLANPVTWAAIVDDPSAAGPSTAVQDSLSSHLDTLERHLIHEITLRSTSFFSALSNLQDLHSESASCLSRIADLQTSLKDVGSKQAKKGLEIIDAHERLRTLRVTERGVKAVAELEELIRVTKGLVDAGDWAGGLGFLEDVVRWWEKYSASVDGESSLPVSTLPALTQLPAAISDLTNSIATQLESALTALLLSVLADAETGDKSEEILRAPIEPMLEGLARCGRLEELEALWREVMLTTIREGSRKHLPVPQAEEDPDEEGKPPEQRGANLAQSLKAMDHSRYLLLSTQMYSTLLSRLRLGQKLGDILSDILASATSLPVLTLNTSVPATPKPVPELDLADVVSSSCELANNRASKILAVRSEQHAALSLIEFHELFKESWDFVLATESLAKRMIVSLRGVTASQARAFLVSYHAQRLTRSAKLVEEELWTQIDVPAEAQHVVNLLIESAVSDPPEAFIPPRAPLSNGNGNGHSNGNGEATPKTLTVEDKTFFIVKATAESLVLLGDYLKIVINLELVVTDVMGRIIEFLKSFNSRTCQVVLGAGAMRSAGLKNITAKHLALASQSLSVVVSLIPYIREFIRRHLSAKQAVMLTEFDKLKRDYQEHQNEIHAKLVAIMSDRIAVHVGALREIDWEASSEKDSARPYAEMLVKETATLHKVLSKYLATQTVEGVMSEVLAAIVYRLSEEYGKVELKSDEAKKRMTQDVTLISTRLSPLSEAGTNVKSLETLVRDKPTPRKMGDGLKGLLRRGSGKKGEAAKDVEPEADEVGDDDQDEDGDVLVESNGTEGIGTTAGIDQIIESQGPITEAKSIVDGEPNLKNDVSPPPSPPILSTEPTSTSNSAETEHSAPSDDVPEVPSKEEGEIADKVQETAEPPPVPEKNMQEE
ncbi:Vps54-like protein-domain-containing protein [Naematelia encephala]|uniref:Vps54-like protein-domain-containing protein n=1 Tax=Naematelia encephala TaxID=71784 RepID=A0A1Y2ANB1_9TREE|nr:Vps54-like protein-domain-containing protein [Naematelia encephala]